MKYSSKYILTFMGGVLAGGLCLAMLSLLANKLDRTPDEFALPRLFDNQILLKKGEGLYAQMPGAYALSFSAHGKPLEYIVPEGDQGRFIFMRNDQSNNPLFSVTHQKAQWSDLEYGKTIGGKKFGEHYQDINGDGRFDNRLTYDETGKLISREIDLNDDWKLVNEIDSTLAHSDKEYIFTGENGWKQK